jgi:hypothetical protein
MKGVEMATTTRITTVRFPDGEVLRRSVAHEPAEGDTFHARGRDWLVESVSGVDIVLASPRNESQRDRDRREYALGDR